MVEKGDRQNEKGQLSKVGKEGQNVSLMGGGCWEGAF